VARNEVSPGGVEEGIGLDGLIAAIPTRLISITKTYVQNVCTRRKINNLAEDQGFSVSRARDCLIVRWDAPQLRPEARCGVDQFRLLFGQSVHALLVKTHRGSRNPYMQLCPYHFPIALVSQKTKYCYGRPSPSSTEPSSIGTSIGVFAGCFFG
jgi:hypothetical protein